MVRKAPKVVKPSSTWAMSAFAISRKVKEDASTVKRMELSNALMQDAMRVAGSRPTSLSSRLAISRWSAICSADRRDRFSGGDPPVHGDQGLAQRFLLAGDHCKSHGRERVQQLV